MPKQVKPAKKPATKAVAVPKAKPITIKRVNEIRDSLSNTYQSKMAKGASEGFRNGGYGANEDLQKYNRLTDIVDKAKTKKKK